MTTTPTRRYTHTDHTVDLDLCYDEETLEEAFVRIRKDLNAPEDVLTIEVVNPSGPGGGWPIVRWSTRDEGVMSRLIRWYANDDIQEAIMFAMSVEETHHYADE